MGVFWHPWSHTKANWKWVWRQVSKCHAINQWLSRNRCGSAQLCLFLPSWHEYIDEYTLYILFNSVMTAFLFPPGYFSCIPLPKELKCICRSNVILTFCIRLCSVCRLILMEGSVYFLPGFCNSKLFRLFSARTGSGHCGRKVCLHLLWNTFLQVELMKLWSATVKINNNNFAMVSAIHANISAILQTLMNLTFMPPQSNSPGFIITVLWMQ